jgi:hypothetical protein
LRALIYGTWSQQERAWMPGRARLAEECRLEGVEVLAFSKDREPDAVDQLPGVLEQSKAPFKAVLLRPWQRGEVTRAMAPLGIVIPPDWYAPILAVRHGTRGVVVQTIGIEELAAKAGTLRAACSGN